MARIEHIYRYPVKGLSAEPLTAVDVTAGKGLPLDRAFALARASAAFDPAQPEWLPKRNFLMLARDEQLAALQVAFDNSGDGSGRLRIRQDGREVLDAETGTDAGRTAIETFFEAYMPDGERPRLVRASGHMFTDNPTPYLSLINLATVRELGRTMDHELDPLRFRANVYLEGLEPWAEFDWVGKELAAGEVRLACAERIDRCAATNVDPTTAVRDLNIPLALRQAYGHIDCGVLVSVTTGGRLETGQAIGPAP